MSRSSKKVPITGNTKAESEKTDKQIANKRMRVRLKQQLSVINDFYDVFSPNKRFFSNVYSFAKDGKRRFIVTRDNVRLLRK